MLKRIYYVVSVCIAEVTDVHPSAGGSASKRLWRHFWYNMA